MFSSFKNTEAINFFMYRASYVEYTPHYSTLEIFTKSFFCKNKFQVSAYSIL